MGKNWELFYLKVIRKEKKGFLFFFLRALLYTASFFYRGVIAIRNFGYDQNWFSKYTPPVPLVISVGNIVAGGAGKTPVALSIAEEFNGEFPFAILSRGYRSQAEKLSTPIVACQGQGPIHPASFAGDEALLFAQNFPKSIVVVGKDRRQSANLAARLGAKLLILDDALQHRRIARDQEVIVIDVNDPYGLGHFLPRGLLREGKSALNRADIVILNHADNHEAYETLKNELSHYTSAPIIGTCVNVVGAINFLTEEPMELEGKNIGVFCGIAHPEYFIKTLKKLGANIVGEHIIPDHNPLALDDLYKFSKKMKRKNADFLVCTEKDRVKMATLPENILPVAWIKMKLGVIEGKKEWEKFIQKGKDILRSHS